MNFFQTPLDSNIQVLWQPIPVQQIESKAIEELKRENNMLKSQLMAVMNVRIRRFRDSKCPKMIKCLSDLVITLKGISTHHPHLLRP